MIASDQLDTLGLVQSTMNSWGVNSQTSPNLRLLWYKKSPAHRTLLEKLWLEHWAGLESLTAPSSQVKGGFYLADLIITELKSHMTCYNSMPCIGWNYSIQTGEQIL